MAASLTSRRPGGFTLIELVVVLMILGVAGAMVVPALAGKRAAETTASELAAIYRAARDAAVDRAVVVTVALDLRSGRYEVFTDPAEGAAAQTIRTGTLGMSSGVRLRGESAAGWVVTSFDPFGRARGGWVEIADGEERYEVSTDPWTASVATRRR